MRAQKLPAAALLALLALSPAASADTGLPLEVVARPVGTGVVFTDQKGMSLYTYGRDEDGKSRCTARCADLWPPLLVKTPPETVKAEWTTVDRGNGVKQWAYKGQPLYGYAVDAEPGTSFGDSFGEVWHLAKQDF